MREAEAVLKGRSRVILVGGFARFGRHRPGAFVRRLILSFTWMDRHGQHCACFEVIRRILKIYETILEDASQI